MSKPETPTEPGFYKASIGTVRYLNAIVEIYGEAPFLRLRYWIPGENKGGGTQYYLINFWGPKLEPVSGKP